MNKSSHVTRTRGVAQVRGHGERAAAERDGRHALSRDELERQLGSDRCEVEVVHLGAVRAALAALPHDVGLAQTAELLGLLSNPTRLRMLMALQPDAREPRAELCVCDLATVSRASKSLTSHQLRLLRMAGLVRQRRAGKLTFYRLADGPLVPLLASLTRLARQRGDEAAADAALRRRPR